MNYRVYPLVSGEYGYEKNSLPIGAWAVASSNSETELRFPAVPPQGDEPGQVLPVFVEVFNRRSDAEDKAAELNQQETFRAMTTEKLSGWVYGSSLIAYGTGDPKAFHESLVQGAMRAWQAERA
jgi:hypothetical protein